jgi:predicted PurR-regulated permease PerM
MVVGKSFLIPLAWALLIGMASYPMLDKIEERTGLSRSLVNGLFLVLLLICLVGLGFFFYVELSSIFKDLPTLANTVSAKLQDLSTRMKSTGIAIPDHVNSEFISDWVKNHNNVIINILSGIGGSLWNIILIMFYMFFLLYYRDLVVHFYMKRYSSPQRIELARHRFERSLEIVRSYLNGLLKITIISAVMNYVVFIIFGLKYALFFASFLAVLNLIPFIGNPIGLVIIMLFAFVTKDNLVIPMLIFISLFIMNFLQDNVVRPWIMGDKMKLNAFAVFVATIVGGMIWGVSGMILFIPITGVIKILLESREQESAFAILFSELPQKPKEKKSSKARPNTD